MVVGLQVVMKGHLSTSKQHRIVSQSRQTLEMNNKRLRNVPSQYHEPPCFVERIEKSWRQDHEQSQLGIGMSCLDHRGWN